MNDEQARDDELVAPDWPLWHGVPRMAPPPFGRPGLSAKRAVSSAAGLSTSSTGVVPHTAAARQTQPAPTPPPSPAATPPSEPRRPTTIGMLTPPMQPVSAHARPAPPRASRPVVLTAAVTLLTVAAVYVTMHRSQTSVSGPKKPSVASQSAPGTVALSQAVSELADEPVIEYHGEQTAENWSATSWDIYVTADGDRIGTALLDGEKVSILVVGGATYVQAPANLLGSTPAATEHTWVTGADTLIDDLPAGLETPSVLAARLHDALLGTHAQTTSFDGTAAIEESTTAGELYVTTSSPYRVLGFVSAATGGVVQSFKTTTSDADNQVYRQLISETGHLDTAVNLGVQFYYRQSEQASCSTGACTVTEQVTASIASDQSGATLAASVPVVMTATITHDGQPDGTCTTTSYVPTDGSSTVISCIDSDRTTAAGHAATTALAAVTIEAPALTQAQIDQLQAQEQSDQEGIAK